MLLVQAGVAGARGVGDRCTNAHSAGVFRRGVHQEVAVASATRLLGHRHLGDLTVGAVPDDGAGRGPCILDHEEDLAARAMSLPTGSAKGHAIRVSSRVNQVPIRSVGARTRPATRREIGRPPRPSPVLPLCPPSRPPAPVAGEERRLAARERPQMVPARRAHPPRPCRVRLSWPCPARRRPAAREEPAQVTAARGGSSCAGMCTSTARYGARHIHLLIASMSFLASKFPVGANPPFGAQVVHPTWRNAHFRTKVLVHRDARRWAGPPRARGHGGADRAEGEATSRHESALISNASILEPWRRWLGSTASELP